MNAERRTWSINGDFVTLQQAGVARYAREVTLALDALVAEGHPLAADLDLALLAPRQPQDLPLRRIPTRVIPEFDRPRLPQVWVQLQLPRHARGGLLSFCNLAPVLKRRHIVCIHDLHTRIMPESYGRLFRLAHRAVLPMLGRNAGRIATVSQLSRDHLVKFGVAPAGKIVVTYNGSDHALRWSASASRLQPAGPRPFVLCLGRNQRYKNTELMWRLAPALDAMGLDIAIAGDIGRATLNSHGPVPGNVRLLGRIGDDDLACALSRALCFLFPSRIEGFGLPAVEAMALGCPLVASTAPCLPEVCGDAALLADPDDAEAWIAAIRRLSREPDLRADLVARGLERAKAYSWRSIAETYLALMAQVDREAAAAKRACRIPNGAPNGADEVPGMDTATALAGRAMKLVVIVPTIGRKEIVNRVLQHLGRQSRPPDEVIVSAPDPSHVEPFPAARFPVSYVFGRRGLCAQRNQALESALGRFDIITFFDDDFLPASDYLEKLVCAFEEHSDWAVIHGNVVVDGVRGPGLGFEEGLRALQCAQAAPHGEPVVRDHPGAYGCNMSMRAKHVGALRFDERLVLYGWQEDIDFTNQLGRYGRIVSLSSLIGVHLGVKGGRLSGVRHGYSQIVNPVYLLKKGTMPAWFALDLMARNVSANVVKSLWPEPYVDRRGRLRGNLLAAYHLMQGRIEPEFVLKL